MTPRRGCARSRTPRPSVKPNVNAPEVSPAGRHAAPAAVCGRQRESIRAHGLPTTCPPQTDARRHQLDVPGCSRHHVLVGSIPTLGSTFQVGRRQTWNERMSSPVTTIRYRKLVGS